jgi:hypothetical protein
MVEEDDNYQEEIEDWLDRMAAQVETQKGFGVRSIANATTWRRFVEANLGGATGEQQRTLSKIRFGRMSRFFTGR